MMRAIFCAALLAVPAPDPVAALSVDPPPALSADTQLPARGSTLTFAFEGPPGAFFQLALGFTPLEVVLDGIGTLFVSPVGAVNFASGFIPAEGVIDVPFFVPDDPTLDGALFYVQGGVFTLAAELALTNALPVRIGATAPSGPRESEALAATPDGARLLVAHRRDATLSVIDTLAGTVLADLPYGKPGGGVPQLHADVTVDPQGRHAFVVDGTSPDLVVLHVASLSVAARLPVGKGARRVACDFSGATPRVYVTQERDGRLLAFDELVPGFFVAAPPIVLEGRRPGPLVVRDDGKVIVGHLGSHELELVDPAAAPGATTLLRVDLGRIPHGLALASGSLLVATFTPVLGIDGVNHVLRMDPSTLALVSSLHANQGTDYVDVVAGAPFAGVVAEGTGTVLLLDSTTFALEDRVVLAPGQPSANPQRAALLDRTGSAGAPTHVYTVDLFRETVRPVALQPGGPGVLEPEIALAWSGFPRIPLVDLTPAENGERFFRSVDFMKGSPLSPNTVTCATCHPDGGTDGHMHPRNSPHMFGLDDTAPYFWPGVQPNLTNVIQSTFSNHSDFGGSPPAGSVALMRTFFETALDAPPSPHLGPGGALTPAAQAGKLVFEGAAGCSACHVAPVFVPVSPSSPTIPSGVGTGLAPANVPSLRAAWASEPYFHDGSAATLLDVLLRDTGDLHGTTSTLTPSQRDELVAYLLTL